jgi:basic membrane protein A and related proteins
MGMQTRRTWRSRALAGVAAASMMVLAACGGTTGEETSGDGDAGGEDLPLVYGVFATPLEEPWDGAIHAALESAVEDGVIEYRHVDNVITADAMERTLRNIAANEQPDAIMGDAFAAEARILSNPT